MSERMGQCTNTARSKYIRRSEHLSQGQNDSPESDSNQDNQYQNRERIEAVGTYNQNAEANFIHDFQVQTTGRSDSRGTNGKALPSSSASYIHAEAESFEENLSSQNELGKSPPSKFSDSRDAALPHSHDLSNSSYSHSSSDIGIADNGPHPHQIDQVNHRKCAGTPITLSESMLAIQSLSPMHKLSEACLANILEYFLEKRKFHGSCEMFKKYCVGIYSQLGKPYICSLRCSLLHCQGNICSTCNYFLHGTILGQLENLFKRPGFVAGLLYSHERMKKVEDNYGNVYDDSIPRERRSEVSIFCNKSSLSLPWNCDGIPTTGGSKCCWPFYFAVCNPSHHDRSKSDSVLSAGLWYDFWEPISNLFLGPFKNETQRLKNEIDFTTSDGSIFVRGGNIHWVADVPARASLFSMNLYNLDLGWQKREVVSVQIERRLGQKRIFPFVRDLFSMTDEEAEQHAAQAFAVNSNVHGVKSICSTCDDLQFLYQSIVIKILDFCLSKEHRNSQKSLFQLLRAGSYGVFALKPPDVVQPLPLLVYAHHEFRRDSEIKDWMFFYFLQVLSGNVQQTYFDNWKLLVMSRNFLSKNSTSEKDEAFSPLLFSEIVSRFKALYDKSFMTCDSHQLSHLPETAENLGPLWAYSSFPLGDQDA